MREFPDPSLDPYDLLILLEQQGRMIDDEIFSSPFGRTGEGISTPEDAIGPVSACWPEYD